MTSLHLFLDSPPPASFQASLVLLADDFTNFKHLFQESNRTRLFEAYLKSQKVCNLIFDLSSSLNKKYWIKVSKFRILLLNKILFFPVYTVHSYMIHSSSIQFLIQRSVEIIFTSFQRLCFEQRALQGHVIPCLRVSQTVCSALEETWWTILRTWTTWKTCTLSARKCTLALQDYFNTYEILLTVTQNVFERTSKT